MESEVWGWELIINCRACEKEKITNEQNLRAFAKELVDQIDMKAYGEPILEHFAKDDPTKAGYTLVQLIETSAVTGHFVDKNGNAYINIFSCKLFQIEKALSVVFKYFKPKGYTTQFIIRKPPENFNLS